MKKILFVFSLAFILTGCSLPFQSGLSADTTTTNKITSLSQLDQASLDNITQQVMNQVKQEIEDQYAQNLTDTENMIINVVNTDASAVLGVSNFQTYMGSLREVSSGSGVIYKHDLDNGVYYMITNNHVVDGAEKLSVVLPDQTYVDATLVGTDPVTDIAVITFNSTLSLPTVEFADSDKLQVGQFAIAIGNPLGYDYYGSVTSGIVSGLARDLPIDYNNDGIIDWDATLIQHDAAISPGNSGGGLFDIHGKLIGINNMKIVDSDVSNIGFAIPSNTVSYIASQLEEFGQVVRPSLGITGLAVSDIIQNNAYLGKSDSNYIPLPDGVTSGVYVNTIVDNSSSTNSGLQSGDIITKYNDVNIDSFTDLKLQIDNAKVGDQVTLTVNRDGTIVNISLILIQRPSS